jgi:hypothetical protein
MVHLRHKEEFGCGIPKIKESVMPKAREGLKEEHLRPNEQAER